MARRPAALALPAAEPPVHQDDAAPLWALVEQGQVALATVGLIRLLATRPNDSAALLAARLLQLPKGVEPEVTATRVLSASMTELAALVKTQDAQIAALMELLEQ